MAEMKGANIPSLGIDIEYAKRFDFKNLKTNPFDIMSTSGLAFLKSERNGVLNCFPKNQTNQVQYGHYTHLGMHWVFDGVPKDMLQKMCISIRASLNRKITIQFSIEWIETIISRSRTKLRAECFSIL